MDVQQQCPQDGLVQLFLGNFANTFFFATESCTRSQQSGAVQAHVLGFAGTPGASNCHDQSTSALAHKYGGMSQAASALNKSVKDLQADITLFCGSIAAGGIAPVALTDDPACGPHEPSPGVHLKRSCG